MYMLADVYGVAIAVLVSNGFDGSKREGNGTPLNVKRTNVMAPAVAAVPKPNDSRVTNEDP